MFLKLALLTNWDLYLNYPVNNVCQQTLSQDLKKFEFGGGTSSKTSLKIYNTHKGIWEMFFWLINQVAHKCFD